MKNFVLWTIVIVLYFVSTFPPLVCSEKLAAKIAHTLLAAILGGALGFGFGHALASIW